jgi:pimeloyl-ACP methyl ester carboxylesterase
VTGRGGFTVVDGLRLHSYVVGRPDRGDLVLVPGLCVSSYLRPAADALAGVGYRVHLVDPPGWPYSPAQASPPGSVGELAGWLVRWLATTDLRGITLVGQSFGAQLAAHVAVACPDRVRVLVLQGPTFDPAYRSLPRAMMRLLRDFPRERPSLLLVETPEWLRVGLRRVLATARLALRDRLEDTMRTVSVATVVVVGEHDTLATPAWSRSLVERAHDGQHHIVMPGLPHSSPHADPSGFAQLMRELSRR